MSQDQVRIETIRQQAILRAGKKFINLLLIEPKMNRIQGAVTLHAKPYEDANGMMAFSFEEKGGPLNFNLDEIKGGYYCQILDCEHNRRFLATHVDGNFWQIEDEKVRGEIHLLSEQISNEAVSVPVKHISKETLLTDEDLETEMARLQHEQSQRKLNKVLLTENAMKQTSSTPDTLQPDNVQPEPEVEPVVKYERIEDSTEPLVTKVIEKKRGRKKKSDLVTVK